MTVVERPERRETVTVSWRDVQGNFVDQVTRAGRLSDLVVFGPLGADEKPGLSDAFEATLLETGRPVLLTAQVPPKEFRTAHRRRLGRKRAMRPRRDGGHALSQDRRGPSRS